MKMKFKKIVSVLAAAAVVSSCIPSAYADDPSLISPDTLLGEYTDSLSLSEAVPTEDEADTEIPEANWHMGSETDLSSSIYPNDSAAFIYEYTGTSPYLQIPTTLKGYNVGIIGASAFTDKTLLSGVIFPNTVTSIYDGNVTEDASDCRYWRYKTGPGAFKNCTSLSYVKLSSNLTNIGNYAFYNCYSLNSISIPGKVTRIGSYAFQNCSGLQSLSIPDNVTQVEAYAFANCSGIRSLRLSNNMTKISSSAFYGCSGLTSVTIPSRVTSIGDYAFSNCYNLSSITIPSNVTSISDTAFSNCYNLTIYCTRGSYAERYARSYGINYRYIAKPVITKAQGQNGQVALNWTAVSGATNYAVYYTVGGKWYNAGTRTTNGMYVRNLRNGTRYGFAVKAYVNGSWSGVTSADIVYATPSASGTTTAKPRITKVVPQNGQVALNWTNVSGATQYAVYYTVNGRWTLAGKRTTNGMYVRNLSNYVMYGFAVKAYVNGSWTSVSSSDIVYAAPTAAKGEYIENGFNDLTYLEENGIDFVDVAPTVR